MQRAFGEAPRTNLLEIAIINSERAMEDNEIGKMLCQLVKQQLARSVDIEQFDGNPLQYTYFRSMFRVVVKKIINPQGRLTQMIKLANGEVRMLFIHDNPK